MYVWDIAPIAFYEEIREVAHQTENIAQIVTLLRRRAPLVTPFDRDAAPRAQLPAFYRRVTHSYILDENVI